jgi:hypothetical protein
VAHGERLIRRVAVEHNPCLQLSEKTLKYPRVFVHVIRLLSIRRMSVKLGSFQVKLNVKTCQAVCMILYRPKPCVSWRSAKRIGAVYMSCATSRRDRSHSDSNAWPFLDNRLISMCASGGLWGGVVMRRGGAHSCRSLRRTCWAGSRRCSPEP